MCRIPGMSETHTHQRDGAFFRQSGKRNIKVGCSSILTVGGTGFIYAASTQFPRELGEALAEKTINHPEYAFYFLCLSLPGAIIGLISKVRHGM